MARVLKVAMFFWGFGMFELGLVAAASLGLATAQASDDWDFSADPTTNSAVASIEYGGGVSLYVTCRSGYVMVLLGGIPANADAERAFIATRADGTSRTTTWLPTTGSPLLRSYSARTARFLKGGGGLTLRSAPGEPQPARLAFDLPSQSANLDRVLTACNYATVDDRDERVFQGPDVLADLRMEIPSAALREHPSLTVDISCVVSSGRLIECRSDHQTPHAPEAGAITARAVNGTRLRRPDPAAEGKVVDFSLVSQAARR